MTLANQSIADLLRASIGAGKAIVVCGRTDDAEAWRRLLATVAPGRSLVIALDEAARVRAVAPVPGATAQLAWQHDALAALDGSGWLCERANAFDPDGDAVLLLPDPLDPQQSGSRRRLGRRPSVGRILEDKTVVDAFWDAIGVERAPSIVADLPIDLRAVGGLVDAGNGVVCSCQRRGGGPTAGGDGIWWWRTGAAPPPGALRDTPGGTRVRVMPLLAGLPVRLHGLVLADRVACFPPMEIVSLLRSEQGTFLCAGAAPTVGPDPGLTVMTHRIGTGLRSQYGYRGAFSADGILTFDGFRPTDLNARLTSAIEPVAPEVRVRLHAANLLARDGWAPKADEIDAVVMDAFAQRDRYTIYAAATRLPDHAPRRLDVRWQESQLVQTDGRVDGQLTVTRTHRGWQLTVKLLVDRLPVAESLGSLTPEVFRLCDRVLGTDFGLLAPATASPPAAR